MKIQVQLEHYKFMKYNHLNRWNSYWYQLNEIFTLKPKNVLEIGPGGKILKSILENENIKYKSVDIDKKLNPDYVLNISSDLFFLKSKFDVVVAFQVLEHIEYKYFEICLKNLKSVSNKYLLLSIPYFGPYFRFNLNFYPFFKFNFLKKLYYPKKLNFDGQHYWEIGRKNYPLKKILFDINKYYIIKKKYLCPENPFHYFLVLEVRN